MDTLNWMLALIFTGFLLMGAGFSFRDHAWGIAVLAAGIVVMLSTVGFKLYVAFNHV